VTFNLGSGAAGPPGPTGSAGAPLVVSSLPSGTLPTGNEPVAVYQGGTWCQIPVSAFLQRANVTSGNGIDITLRAGATSDPAATGGNIFGSAGVGIYAGGSSQLIGGNAGTYGGWSKLIAGDAASSSGAVGGGIHLLAGTAANGGDILGKGGRSLSSAGSGGEAYIIGGDSYVGSGGKFIGKGGNAPTAGDSWLKGGDREGTVGTGGTVTLIPGHSGGAIAVYNFGTTAGASGTLYLNSATHVLTEVP